MKPLPAAVLHGPFTRAEAEAAGVSRRMLSGARFVRVLPRVWRHRDHEMTEADWVLAARKTLPDRARTTGLTRIRQLGLDFGSPRPVRFVIEGDHHLVYDEVFLHRTVKLPPCDDTGVTAAAAYLSFCSGTRVIDAIKVGDWLLYHRHMTTSEVQTLALSEPWRDGAAEALWVLPHLDGRSRSLPESETRVVLRFAGLPVAEVNASIDVGEDLKIVGDLVYVAQRVLVEYEGAQHQEDRDQYVADLDRYELLRRAEVRYVQVTRERLRHARTLVGTVFRELVAAGYDGPPPDLGSDWSLLFARLSDVVGPRNRRSAVA